MLLCLVCCTLWKCVTEVIRNTWNRVYMYLNSINVKLLWREIWAHSTVLLPISSRSHCYWKGGRSQLGSILYHVSSTTHWRNVRRTLQVNIAWDSDNLQCTDNTDCRWPNYHYKHLLAPDSSPDAGGCHLLLNHVPMERLQSSYPGSCGIRVSKQLMVLMQEFNTVPG